MTRSVDYMATSTGKTERNFTSINKIHDHEQLFSGCVQGVVRMDRKNKTHQV